MKSDAETTSRFETAGSRRWAHAREGRAPVTIPNHKLPDEALDDPDVMAERARLAMEASERAASAKPNTRASQGRHADNLRVDNRETAGDPP